MWWRPGYGYITGTKSPRAKPFNPLPPIFLSSLCQPLPPPSPSASPPTRPPHRSVGAGSWDLPRIVRKRRGSAAKGWAVRDARGGWGEGWLERGRLKPAFLRPTANFIPNLRNGRANELLNYSVASRKGAAAKGGEGNGRNERQRGRTERDAWGRPEILK